MQKDRELDEFYGILNFAWVLPEEPAERGALLAIEDGEVVDLEDDGYGPSVLGAADEGEALECKEDEALECKEEETLEVDPPVEVEPPPLPGPLVSHASCESLQSDQDSQVVRRIDFEAGELAAAATEKISEVLGLVGKMEVKEPPLRRAHDLLPSKITVEELPSEPASSSSMSPEQRQQTIELLRQVGKLHEVQLLLMPRRSL